MIKNQRLGRGKLTKMVRDIEDEIPGLKRKSFMDNITSIIDQLMNHHQYQYGDTSNKLDPKRFQRESSKESEDYMTMAEIRKMWKKEYPGVKFGFKKVRGGGSEWLLVVSPQGTELERYQNIPKLGWLKTIVEGTEEKEEIKSLEYMLDMAQKLSSKSMFFKARGGRKAYIKMLKHKLKKLGVVAESSAEKEDIKSLQSILDVATELSPKSPYFKGRGGKDKYIKMIKSKLDKLGVHEMIKVPISVGDTVLGGKFKNKKVVVKKIGKNEKGDLTINGRPLLKYRLAKKKGTAFKEGRGKRK